MIDTGAFLVSIHTLHELEARPNPIWRKGIRGIMVSIHTLHELEASQQKLDKLIDLINVSIHTLHELEASILFSR